MRLLLDAMFAAKLAVELRSRGIDATAIDGDSSFLALSDQKVFLIAQLECRVVVTENVRHFRPLAEQAYGVGDGHPGTIFVARSQHSVGSPLSALVQVAKDHPGDDDLRNRELWL